MSKDKKKPPIEILQLFDPKKLDEFEGMTAQQRLNWLEESNLFITQAIGFEGRALTDKRFEGFEKLP